MNKVVVITGASRGLGLSLAQRFLAEGNTVYGASLTKKHWSVAEASVSRPENFFLETLDLTKEAQVKKWISQIFRKAKRIDLLINNAGYGGKSELTDELTLKELKKNIEQNLLGSFLTSKYSLPIFRKQKKGFLINVSSMAGVRAVPKLFAYSAAKFGVLALTQCLAKENPDWNFKAITVCPGGMNTEMRAKFFGKEDAAKQQSPDFVADVMMRVIRGELVVESGGHIVIRHSQISGIYPPPVA